MTEIVLLQVNAATVAEARRIGRALVEEGLAAAVNILPEMRSFFRWQGRLRERSEALLLAKLPAEGADAAVRRVREMHSYDRPAIVIVPVVGGDAAYLDWVRAGRAD